MSTSPALGVTITGRWEDRNLRDYYTFRSHTEAVTGVRKGEFSRARNAFRRHTEEVTGLRNSDIPNYYVRARGASGTYISPW